MDKIVVTADFHIGLISDSYMTKDGLPSKVEETFKQIDFIIDYCIKNKSKILIICGDIFESNKPIPKYLRMFIERLNKLEANEITTYIIKGNHDESSLNEDALSPLTKIEYTYIHIIREISNIVDITRKKINYIFIPHINSLKDKVEDEIKKLISDNGRYIIIGHLHAMGAVTGSEQSIIKGGINFIDLKDTKKIEKIFLGHIHKFQQLNNKLISYPGSIVRTDFGETEEEKGFIEYDLDSKKETFIKLNTIEYKNINIDLVSKSHVDLNDEKLKKLKDKIVKLKINILESNRNKFNLTEIKEKFSKYCYISRIEYNIVKEKNEIKKYSKQFSNNELLEDYIQELKLKKELSSSVLKKAKDIMNNIELREKSIHIVGKIILLDLHLENFRSFEKVDLDLRNITVAGIIGTYSDNDDKSNGVGKTTLFLAIIYALFGNCQNLSDNDLKRKDEKNFLVRLKMQIGKSDIMIERGKNGKSSFLKLIVDNKDISEKINETNKTIIDLIGMDYNLFINTVYFLDDNSDEFCASTKSVRKEYLRNILNLKIWDGCLDIIKSESKQLIIDEEVIDTTIENIKTKIEDINIEKSQTMLNAIEEDIKNNNIELDKINSIIADFENKLTSQKAIEDIYNTFLNESKELKDEIESLKISIDKYKSQLKLIDNKSIDINIDILTKELEKLKKEKDDIVEENIVIRTQGESTKESLNELKKNKSNVCNVCGNKIEQNVKIKLIEEKEKILVELRKKYDVRKDSIKEYENNIHSLESQVNGLNKNINEIKILKDKINSFVDNLENVQRKYEKNEIKVNETKEKYKNIKKIDKEKYKEYKSNQDTLKEINDSLNKKKTNILVDIKSYKNLQKELKENNDKLEVIKKDSVISNYIIDIFGKNGISAKVINDSLNEISDYSNNILSEIDGGEKEIVFSSSKQNSSGDVVDSLDIYIKDKDNVLRKYETYSGGERTIINFSIRLALSNILSKRNNIWNNVIILDEVFGKLDEYNKDKVIHIINFLKKQFDQIFAISHSNLRDAFSNLIWIEKDTEKNISYIKKVI